MNWKQQTLAMAVDQSQGFEHYRKPTQRDAFLPTMGEIVACRGVVGAVRGH